jgi:propanediol utilization protein
MRGGSLDEIERIAEEVIRRLGASSPTAGPTTATATATIPVSVSARHVHVSRSVLDRLYGEGFSLTRRTDLGQPGEFASAQTVTLVGQSMRAIEDVRVLGPVRTYTQVEISGTDAVRLGIDPPIRRSGDLAGSEPITLVGPVGTVRLSEGAIRAMRHIHMTERDAEIHRVKDGDPVRVRFPGPAALVLENVLIRVSKSALLELHLDTDNANAADVRPPMTVEILHS